MGAISEDQQGIVDAAVAEISHIATLPEITLKIIELVEDPSSTAQDLHNVISNDPVMTSPPSKETCQSYLPTGSRSGVWARVEPSPARMNHPVGAPMRRMMTVSPWE